MVVLRGLEAKTPVLNDSRAGSADEARRPSCNHLDPSLHLEVQ